MVRITIAVVASILCHTAFATTDWSTKDYDLYTGDFDGDGKSDLLYVAKDPSKPSGIAKSDGTGPNISFQSWPSNYLGIPWSGNQYNIIVGDFNGDGKADLLLQRRTAGDHYLLLADANGKFTSISQTINNSALGLMWSADSHALVAGNFDGDPNHKTDLFFQAKAPSGLNAVLKTDSNGQFTVAAIQSWNDGFLGFKWSAANAIIFAGDFNGDGNSDLLIQAKPNFVLIDSDVSIPVPIYPPNMNGIVKSVGGTTPFALAGVLQWSRKWDGVDWSPLVSNLIAGDFNGDGRTDVIVQGRNTSQTSSLLLGNSSGAAFGAAAALASNVTWTGNAVSLMAGNFDGGAAVGLYLQATSPSGSNGYANTVNGATVAVTPHDPANVTGLVPATAVGRTAGSFAISNTGSATYTIPLTVPKGVAGLQPTLAVAYASGSSNGLLGVGWGLTGLSEISRCPQNLVQDNAVVAVTLSATDKFCLDGNRLRLTGGTYGAAGSTYQTELEQFSLITASGTAGAGPASFTVKGKDGLTYEYGATADSRIESVGSATARLWAIDKVTDRSGNTMSVSYNEDTTNGSYRPNQILYTANSGAGLSAAYKVSFVWEARPTADVLVNYFAGSIVKELNRLNRIETYYGAALVRKYQLSYNTSGAGPRSRLASIQECEGKTSSCLPATMISWKDGTGGWSSTSSVATNASTALMDSAYAVDFDGDGFDDIIYPQFSGSTATWYYMKGSSSGFAAPVNTTLSAGTTANPTYLYALPIDFLSEGRRGLIVNVPGNSTLQLLRWTGSAFAYTATNSTVTLVGKEWVGDFNGDGREDLMYATTVSGNGNLNVQLNGGISGGTAQLGTSIVFYSASLGSSTMDAFHSKVFSFADRVLDFNGDGKGDFIYQTTSGNCDPPGGCLFSTTWTVLQSTGTAFTALQSWTCTRAGVNAACPVAPVVGDFNGDGLTDIVSAAGTWGSSISYVLRYGSGTGLTGGTTVTVPSDFNTQGFAADLDGDGRSDILYAPSPTTGNWSVIKFDGTNFGSAADAGFPSGSSNSTVRLLDVDGDGQKDIGYNNTQYNLRKHLGTFADLVSSITDGFGNTVGVTYAPLTDSTVYTKGTGAVFPEIDLQSPIYVVKQLTASDGIGGTYKVTASYQGARVHVQGRGFEGFSTRSENRTESDGSAGLKTTWAFSQSFPNIGAVTQSTIAQPSGGPTITQTTNTYTDQVQDPTAFNDRHFPYVSQSVQVNYEVKPGDIINGQAVTQVTTTTVYDSLSNGTPKSVTTVAQDSVTLQSYSQATVNTFAAADTANWCLGFVTQQAITNVVPGLTGQTRTTQFVADTDPTKCRVKQQIVEPSDTTWKVTTLIGYDSYGNPNSQTVTGVGMTGRTTTASYGAQGVFPLTVTNALSQSVTRTWDYALGVPLTETDPNTIQVTWQYDGFGRKARETRPDGTATTSTYAGCGAANGFCGDGMLRYQIQEAQLDSTGGVIRSGTHLFDSNGRSLYDQTQTLSGGISTMATSYDSKGRISRRSLPYFQGSPAYYVSFTYDLIDRPLTETRQVSETDTGTQVLQYGYAKLIETQTDALGKVTTKQKNAIGQVIKMTDPNTGVTQYQFDQFGNLTKTIDPLGNQMVNVYNIRGLKSSISDPDMGSWTYSYNALGEMTSQIDAKTQITSFTYDALSRPLTRVEAEGTTTWTWGTSSALKNIGKLQSISSPGSYSESYTYDTLGRPLNQTTNADASSFVVSNTYNATSGLLETVTYPTSTTAVPGSRFKVQYDYANGLLKDVKDFNTPSVIYWQAVSTTATGQPIDEQFGNGLHTYSSYDEITGRMYSRSTGATNQIQNLTYQWDKVGNLTERKDLNLSLTEHFFYDNLYRLDHSTLNGVQNLGLTYDATGNILSKSDVGGAYSYPASGAAAIRPHAVTTAGSNSYGYDANGNMSSRNGDAITWFSYNLPNRINKGSNYSQFLYGAGRGRYKQIALVSSGPLPAGTETTIYIGGLLEKVTKPSGVIEYKHYIMAGKDAVAIRTLRSNSANDTRYLHKDHLGSVDTITDETGAVVVRLSYDSFGKRRNAGVWTGALGAGDWTSVAAITHRAFTFHEQLDNVDLIHMNGRVYDPSIGRFISADPHIQFPTDSQSFNRYSYVENNPLSFADPTGYFLGGLFGSIRRFLHAAIRFLAVPSARNFFEMIHSQPGQAAVDRYIMSHQWAYAVGQFAATAATYWGGGFGGAIWASYYTYRATGSEWGAVRTGLVVFAMNYIMTSAMQAMQAAGGTGSSAGVMDSIDVSYDKSSLLASLSGGAVDSTGSQTIETVMVQATRLYNWMELIPAYGFTACLTTVGTSGGCSASGWGWAVAGIIPFGGELSALKGGSIMFKTAHYADRLAKDGVDVAKAEKAVGEWIDMIRSNMVIDRDVRWRFNLDDVLLEYRARAISDDTVSVGTIMTVK